jgi:hypothetical protein
MTAVNVLQARERTENRIENYPMGQELVSISLEYGESSARRIVSERAKCDKMRFGGEQATLGERGAKTGLAAPSLTLDCY